MGGSHATLVIPLLVSSCLSHSVCFSTNMIVRADQACIPLNYHGVAIVLIILRHTRLMKYGDSYLPS